MKQVMIAAAALLALAACGSTGGTGREVASMSTADVNDTTSNTGDATGTTAPADPAEGALKFAKCMREHGVDMPDPVVQDDGNGGGGVAIQVGGPDAAPVDKDTMDAANKECQHFLAESAKNFDPPSPEEQEKMKEQALEFAKCMREHGIDMPDPQFSEDGGMSVSVGVDDPSGTGPITNGPDVDFNSNEFKDAS